MRRYELPSDLTASSPVPRGYPSTRGKDRAVMRLSHRVRVSKSIRTAGALTLDGRHSYPFTGEASSDKLKILPEECRALKIRPSMTFAIVTKSVVPVPILPFNLGGVVR